MKRSRSSVLCFLSGAASCVVIAAMLGAGASGSGDTVVTSSADGRNAYLWHTSGDSIRFVAQARAPHGNASDDKADKDDDDASEQGNKGENADKQDKGEKGEKGDKGEKTDKSDKQEKGKPDDAGKGKGKDKKGG